MLSWIPGQILRHLSLVPWNTPTGRNLKTTVFPKSVTPQRAAYGSLFLLHIATLDRSLRLYNQKTAWSPRSIEISPFIARA